MLSVRGVREGGEKVGEGGKEERERGRRNVLVEGEGEMVVNLLCFRHGPRCRRQI